MGKLLQLKKADQAVSNLSDIFQSMLLQDMGENAFEIVWAINENPKAAEHFFHKDLIDVALAIFHASNVMHQADKAHGEERVKEKEKAEKANKSLTANANIQKESTDYDGLVWFP